MNECSVPWCEEETTDILGEWWHSKFCDEHVRSLEETSSVRMDLLSTPYTRDRLALLVTQFIESLRNCLDKSVRIRDTYDVERMWYVISFDVNALRTDFYDDEMIFIDRVIDKEEEEVRHETCSR